MLTKTNSNRPDSGNAQEHFNRMYLPHYVIDCFKRSTELLQRFVEASKEKIFPRADIISLARPNLLSLPRELFQKHIFKYLNNREILALSEVLTLSKESREKFKDIQFLHGIYSVYIDFRKVKNEWEILNILKLAKENTLVIKIIFQKSDDILQFLDLIEGHQSKCRLYLHIGQLDFSQIDIKSFQDVERITTLLKRCPNLYKLSLGKFFGGLEVDLRQCSLKKLEKLFIQCARERSLYLPKEMNKLKSLFFGSFIGDWRTLIDEHVVPNLTILYVGYTNGIRLPTKNTHNIRHLHLGSIKGGTDIRLRKKDFPNLQALTFGDVEGQLQLSSDVDNLQKISIGNIGSRASVNLQQCSTTNLAEFTVKSLQGQLWLPSGMPQLRKLDIGKIENPETTNLMQCSFPNISPYEISYLQWRTVFLKTVNFIKKDEIYPHVKENFLRLFIQFCVAVVTMVALLIGPCDHYIGHKILEIKASNVSLEQQQVLMDEALSISDIFTGVILVIALFIGYITGILYNAWLTRYGTVAVVK